MIQEMLWIPATTSTWFSVQISVGTDLSTKPDSKHDSGSLVPKKARVDTADTVGFSFYFRLLIRFNVWVYSAVVLIRSCWMYFDALLCPFGRILFTVLLGFFMLFPCDCSVCFLYYESRLKFKLKINFIHVRFVYVWMKMWNRSEHMIR